MGFKSLGLLIIFFFSINSYASMYVGAKIGMPTSEQEKLADKSEDSVSGSSGGVDLGYRLTNWVALELSYTAVNFDKYEEDLGGGTSWAHQKKFTNLGYGIRIFIWNYLSLKMGGISSSYDLQFEGTGLLAGFNNIEDTGNGSGAYYGLGINIPMGRFDLFVDYDVTVVEFDITGSDDDGHGDTGAQVGLRLNF